MSRKKALRPMDPKRFWDLIGSSARPSQREQLRALRRELSRMDPDDILGFDLRLWQLLGLANRVDLWGAAYLIDGGCSDDGFLYFRCWLVSRGRQAFEAVLADPDSLADSKYRGQRRFELILTAAADAWKSRTKGSDEDFSSALDAAEKIPYPALQGQPWDFNDPDEVRRRLPRLAARFLPEGE